MNPAENADALPWSDEERYERLERMIVHLDVMADALIASMREMLSVIRTRAELDRD